MRLVWGLNSAIGSGRLWQKKPLRSTCVVRYSIPSRDYFLYVRLGKKSRDGGVNSPFRSVLCGRGDGLRKTIYFDSYLLLELSNVP